MRIFACWVLPPATALLALIAYVTRHHPVGAHRPCTWIIEGTLGGVVAAIAYDLYRLPFVLNGAPLFKVFPKFGRLILGADDPAWLVQTVGWTYHFSNGAALGIMFLALMWRASPNLLFWGAVAWALVIEMFMLLTPYSSFLGFKMDVRFIFLTASAHLLFGVTLGLWCERRLSKQYAT